MRFSEWCLFLTWSTITNSEEWQEWTHRIAVKKYNGYRHLQKIVCEEALRNQHLHVSFAIRIYPTDSMFADIWRVVSLFITKRQPAPGWNVYLPILLQWWFCLKTLLIVWKLILSWWFWKIYIICLISIDLSHLRVFPLLSWVFHKFPFNMVPFRVTFVDSPWGVGRSTFHLTG